MLNYTYKILISVSELSERVQFSRFGFLCIRRIIFLILFARKEKKNSYLFSLFVTGILSFSNWLLQLSHVFLTYALFFRFNFCDFFVFAKKTLN